MFHLTRCGRCLGTVACLMTLFLAWVDWFCDVWRCCMPQAVLVCNLHAHVALGGVLGFLAGTWNAAAGELCVRAAVPCLSSNTRACGVPDGFPSAQVVAEVGIRSRRLSG